MINKKNITILFIFLIYQFTLMHFAVDEKILDINFGDFKYFHDYVKNISSVWDTFFLKIEILIDNKGVNIKIYKY
jgi:hypothetical protein